jgi:hypothetical protein
LVEQHKIDITEESTMTIAKGHKKQSNKNQQDSTYRKEQDKKIKVEALEQEQEQQLGNIGERFVVATPSLISASTISEVLSGIDFPKSKDGLKEYAGYQLRKTDVEYAQAVLDLIDQIPDKEYSNMEDIEEEVRRIK